MCAFRLGCDFILSDGCRAAPSSALLVFTGLQRALPITNQFECLGSKDFVFGSVDCQHTLNLHSFHNYSIGLSGQVESGS